MAFPAEDAKTVSLQPGQSIGPYEVVGLIGQGGMGEVWQARDTKLDRDVALKVLPEAFTLDPDRLARFEREAKVLASLNHPNIGSIYGLEEADGGKFRALVLELVEGPTLADRIKQGPIPLDEALPIATQIVEALEAAHEQGVIHRDLKPANVKVKADGVVKVLDFGLAKALDPEPGSGAAANSPTISLTAAATQMGMVIGTAAYMSPEQAKGKVADKRADIWAFGVVLLEMLTGHRVFSGETVSETLAAVMMKEPEWDRLPPDLPSKLDDLLCRCVQKDPRQRVRDIGDVRLAIEGGFETTASAPSEPVAVPQLQVWQRPIPAVVAGLALLAVGGFAVWALLGSGTQPSPSPKRFTLTLPDSDRLPVAAGDMLALSPDSQTLVYVASRDGAIQLFRRPIDQFEATLMPGTEGARDPFVSPDGQWVGFGADGALQKVALVGGPAQTLTALPTDLRGADWGADDMIVYGLMRSGPLMQVPAAGGDPTPLFTPDDGRFSWFPQVLPDGDAVLFTLSAFGPDAGELHLLIRGTGEHRTLVPNAVAGRVLRTGHLVFLRSGALWAVPFDRERLDIVGNPAPVVEGVRVEGGGAVQFALAGDGSLVYIPGDAVSGTRSLVWVDRAGGEEPLAVPARDYFTHSLSPDGTRAAVNLLDDSGNRDVWVSELARGTLTRVTTHAAVDTRPLWHPDGQSVVFASFRDGPLALFRKAADGTGTAEPLVTFDESVTFITPYDWSPDGARLFVDAVLPETGSDVGMVSLDGPGTWEPLIQTAATEWSPALSPNGRWLAYTSNETGQQEVYVQRFPELDGRQVISVGGGASPNWSADGREIIYLRAPVGPRDAVMRVTLDIDEGDPPSLIVGTPERLFDWQYFGAPGGRRHYDVSPDGQRFLMFTAGGTGNTGTGRTEIKVVLNWHQELLDRVPVN